MRAVVKSAPRATRHNNGLVLAVRSASLRSAQRPSAQAATVGQANVTTQDEPR
jgi:hypothetical protein